MDFGRVSKMLGAIGRSLPRSGSYAISGYSLVRPENGSTPSVSASAPMTGDVWVKNPMRTPEPYSLASKSTSRATSENGLTARALTDHCRVSAPGLPMKNVWDNHWGIPLR